MFVYIFAQMSEYIGFCFQGAVIFFGSFSLAEKYYFENQSEISEPEWSLPYKHVWKIEHKSVVR